MQAFTPPPPPFSPDIESLMICLSVLFNACSHLQLALIKINDVQTLIINCVAYLLPCTTSLLSKGQILYVLVVSVIENALLDLHCIEELKFQWAGVILIPHKDMKVTKVVQLVYHTLKYFPNDSHDIQQLQ